MVNITTNSLRIIRLWYSTEHYSQSVALKLLTLRQLNHRFFAQQTALKPVHLNGPHRDQKFRFQYDTLHDQGRNPNYILIRTAICGHYVAHLFKRME